MVNYILRRVLYMIVTVFFVTIIGFALIQLPPGSALNAKIERLRAQGGSLSADQIKGLEERYGLNDPIEVKYFRWVGGAIHGDFGESFTFDTSVNDLIWSRLAFSLLLSFSSLVFAWIVAIPIGVYSATHRYTVPDYIITIIQFIGVAVPEFLLALILLVFAATTLHSDVGGLFSQAYQSAPWSGAKLLDLLSHLWIPVVVIATLFYYTAIIENNEDRITPTPDVVIGVTAFQWAWQFNYTNENLSVVGRPGEVPVLVLPVDHTVRFVLNSTDVAHSFWVPAFLFKRDVIPGRVNQFEITITQPGEYRGHCAEFCGVDHDRMIFSVKAVSWADWQAFIAQQEAARGALTATPTPTSSGSSS